MDKSAVRQGLNWIALGAGLLGLAVILGAFGAHGLKSMVTAAKLTTFQAAVQYHFYHGVGIVLIGLVQLHLPPNTLRWSARMLVGGIVLFSGSLYAMTFVDIKGLGIVTPIGGALFIFGWLALCIHVVKHRASIAIG
ncbi:hypothetical protein A9Q99_24650 [Gammaproteobacteria bacterium 45_16_T64]|nr:hypothetical protein A9Q99_24650 [Gammaproteobacteria bacterium 45_16_T64]